MKRTYHIAGGLALILFAILVTTPATAQSQNSQALDWFRIGLTQEEPEKKVQAYTRAIELDPNFVEALYNLGMAYKKLQDYPHAEQFLYRAYHTNPDKIRYELKLQILFELGTTYRRLGKFNECEEALHGAKGLALDRSVRATVTFELGRCLYEQGRYDEALAALREGEKLNSGKGENFRSFIRLTENAIAAKQLYDAATKAIASGNLEQAQLLVEQLRVKSRGDRNTAAMVTTLDTLLAAEKQKTTLAAIYEQAQKEAAAGNLKSAIGIYENLLQQAGGSYKDAPAKLEAVRSQLAQNELNEKLENEYAAGVAASKAHNWVQAILAFEKVLELNPSFRDARQQLEIAQSELERESTESNVARFYAEGISAMNRNDLGSALAAFEKVRKLNSRYRDVAALLEQVENALWKKTEPAASTTPTSALASSTQLESLYQEALAAMDKEDWMQAVVTLEKLQLLQPDYRDVSTRLATARANLSTAENARFSSDSVGTDHISPYLKVALAALIAVPLLGFVAFSPTARARIYLLRGNYAAAMQIYEKILARSPDRVKLYPLLANIYLLMGRHDEHAMKIYKTVLQLNLATNKREEINSIVAQNYLTEGRTDSDAISVLESALKAERQKQYQGNY